MANKSLLEELAVDAELSASTQSSADVQTKLGIISKTALEMQQKEHEIADLQDQLAIAQKELQEISCLRLPGLMEDVGLMAVTLPDGSKLEINTQYNATIPADRKEEAHSWLEEHGHGDLIKTKVELAFGKGELEQAQELYAKLKVDFDNVSLAQSVHYQTLKAFVKEQVEAGAELPTDLLGVYIGKVTKIKLPKGKK